MVAWQQLIRHWSVLQFAIGWTPFGIVGTIGAVLSAWLIPRLAAQWILAIGAWAQVFPATILMAFCPDFVYTAAQIIASNSVRRSHQGVAASLIGTLNLYGGSLGLGLSGTVETEVNKGEAGGDAIKGYRGALWFGVAIAAVALGIDVCFVRMKKDEREGWEDEGDRDGVIDSEGRGTSTALDSRNSATRLAAS